MSIESESGGGGISSAFVLFLVFLVLKLYGVIDWSWWWITAPLWAPFVFACVLALLLGSVLLLIRVSDRIRYGSWL